MGCRVWLVPGRLHGRSASTSHNTAARSHTSALMKCAPTFHKQPTWLLVSHAMILAQMSTSVWRRSVAVVCSSLSTYGKMPTAAGGEEEDKH